MFEKEKLNILESFQEQVNNMIYEEKLLYKQKKEVDNIILNYKNNLHYRDTPIEFHREIYFDLIILLIDNFKFDDAINIMMNIKKGYENEFDNDFILENLDSKIHIINELKFL